MRMVIIYLTWFIAGSLALSGCGIGQGISRSCGGDLDKVCDLVLGHDSDIVKSNKSKVRELEEELYAYQQWLLGLEQQSVGLEAEVQDLEMLMRDLQSELAEEQLRLQMGYYGATVSEYIDPCGDSPWFDEVLLKMSTGQILAFFQDGGRRGLTVLEDGSYRTTDRQRCSFRIVNGYYEEI